MTKYNHNQICVDNLEVGKMYQYYEDGIIRNIELLEDNSDDEGIKLRIRDTKIDLIFNIFASNEAGIYSGMWRIYPLGTYQIH